MIKGYSSFALMRLLRVSEMTLAEDVNTKALTSVSWLARIRFSVPVTLT